MIYNYIYNNNKKKYIKIFLYQKIIMKILITGIAGFIGSKFADYII